MNTKERVAFYLITGIVLLGWLGPFLLDAASTLMNLLGVALYVAWFYAFAAQLLVPYVKSKGWLSVVALAVALPIVSGCHTTPVGYEMVKVKLLGDDKGAIEVFGTGRYGSCVWSVNVQCYNYPTYEGEYVWTADDTEGSPNDESITFQDINGLSINGDFGIRFKVAPGRSGDVYREWHMDIERLVDEKLRSIVRDGLVRHASDLPVEELYGEGKPAFLDEVHAYVQEQSGDKLEIINVYAIGDFRFDERIRQAISNKIEATQLAQKKEFELRETRAQARIDSTKAAGEAMARLIQAKAEAQANQAIASSISPTLVRYMLAQKWDGKQPTVVGNSGVLLDLKE